MCLGAKVRMRAKHTLEQKDRLEDKCAEQTTRLSKKGAKITHLKSLLSLREAEATEAIRLRCQLSTVEAANAAKSNELRDLKERNFVLEEEKEVLSEKVTTLESVTTAKETELGLKVVSLESKRDSLADQKSSLDSAFELFRERMEAMQDEQTKVLGGRVAEQRWILTHGLKLVLLKCLQSFEYLYALGEAIGCVINKGMQDGLKARIDHRKAGRDLSLVEAYDTSAEAKYVDAVNALCIMDFSLLSVLKSKKDACMADIIDSLRLEGPLAKIPKAE
ncbi:hypothetical protein Tco_1096726 [Tanacetum coccineum]